jgi:dipeptidyl-peptidase-4
MRDPVPCLLLTVLLTASVCGQEPPLLTLEQVLKSGPALQRGLPQTHWIPGTRALAMLRSDGDAANDPVLLQVSPGAEPTPLCDARQVLAVLGHKPAADAPAPFPSWSFLDKTTLRLQAGPSVWHWHPGEAKAELVLQLPAGAEDAAFAPQDKRVAFRLQHDLHVLDPRTGLRRLSWDGGPDVAYGGGAHREEFGISKGLFWSADGRRLLFYREDQRPIAETPLQDLNGEAPQPAHGRYPVAGSRNSRVSVGVYDAEERAVCWLQQDPDVDQYWTNLTFAPDGLTAIVALINRGQDQLQLVRFDARTGARMQTLLEEHDAQWLEPEHGPFFLGDGRFLWRSPKDGHHHLYLHDGDGKLLVQVTRGAFDVQDLLGPSADGSGIWFHASGEDPRQRHLFHATLDGKAVKQLTRERGSHECTLSPDGALALDSWSNLTTPPAMVVLDLAAGTSVPLPVPASPLAGFRMPAQRFFQVQVPDGPVLYGHLLLPPNMAEGTKHPALLYVYGGPHVQLVTDRWLGGASLWLHALADEGYVVCSLDNRGTPNRGIAFEQAIYRQFGVLEVQDQMRAVEYLKAQPFVDPARVGVHGWSYGGYMTLRLLLLQPDAFACGVAGAPVTDWRLYETGYTERYMDTPAENPAGYAAASCLDPALVKNLKAELLVVQGSDDRTVIWSHTLRFLRSCIAAGVFPRYMVYPMQQHGLQGPDRSHFLLLCKRFLDERLKPGG